MSQLYPAVPAKPHQVLSFPSTPNPDQPVHWKTRFEHLHEHGRYTLLGFPFTCIEEKQALLDLYDAVPDLLRDYPGVVDKFFQDADIAMDVAEQSIEDERRRNAPGDPEALIRFRPADEKEVSHG
jgi:hypothetical protein